MANGPIEQPMSNDELRQLIASFAASADERLTRIEQICESNARSVQAASDTANELGVQIREGFAQAASQAQTDISDTVSMIASVTEDVGSLVESTEAYKGEGQADRAEAKEQREAIAQEHADFRVLMQSTLTEIARLWRSRLSA
ncbi:MAG: hypothetical protein F6J97_22000 [Leptolyngbya sp. SIO4C1]|nr:hypothetical protein [Leptolyngbya sp. SIO4C1]